MTNRPLGRDKRLPHAHAAVDVEDVAGDIGGFVAGQEDDGGGDFAILPHAREGMRASISSLTFSGSGSVIGVAIKPGAMALTVMLREATSLAMARVKPIKAAFAAT